ncbi:MAG: ArsR family transcriptional regulator [Proteobacteria bacterium]|nr:ArsR family transcriptional regulator [Pseudomonadota bacterium]
MDTRTKILALLKKKGKSASSELVESIKISRQALASHLSALVETGTVIKTGSTRNAHYEINPHPLKPVRHPHQKKIHLIKKTKGLEEDRVYTEVCRILDLLRFISPHVQTLFGYAFTEILNNAIDHSLSSQVIISVEIFPKEIEFRITDKGIGIFKNIQKSFISWIC